MVLSLNKLSGALVTCVLVACALVACALVRPFQPSHPIISQPFHALALHSAPYCFGGLA